ncbi:hypothetical protein [Streptococcus ovuberis]|uniref:Uncharacterized protein n=1 Tax=Streptococcus ovuberis TaxID=1936207 RepID=A0A7X6S0U6_9STRE|nr:hypothetical protein [Streptococcus ovuberis]NKZ19700.1 hypothetical protein [Streptococcus ovuberis]
MNAKTIIIGFISLIFGIAAVNGLWSAAEGYLKFLSGQRINNDLTKEEGRNQMLFGLAQAGGLGAFLAGIIAAINALEF